MKIANSTVTMSAMHQEASFSHMRQVTIEGAASRDIPAAIVEISKEASDKSYADSIEDYEKRQKAEEEKRREENEKRSLQEMTERLREQNENNQFALPTEDDPMIKLLKMFLAALRGEKIKASDLVESKNASSVLDLRSPACKTGDKQQKGTDIVPNMQMGTTSRSTVWQRITAVSGRYGETESTVFASKGKAVTEDGQTIDFNIEVAMSRSFTAEYNSLSVKEYIKTDPLIINLDSNITSVSDKKYYFDLDSDGKEEQISFAGAGSGFLALDKNGDGKINDGSELFGTKSGDGFKDLAEYDEDGNGWIDENDSVFNRLKIWQKDDDGNDRLIDLKSADVGAIYLKSADTQFSLKNDAHELNAEVKKTGIYLKESTKAVGTINHVDLVI